MGFDEGFGINIEVHLALSKLKKWLASKLHRVWS